MAGARPLALTLSLILEEGLEAAVLRAEVEAIAAAAQRRRRADRRRRHEGRRARRRPTRCTSAPTGIGRRDDRAPRCRPRALRPGDRILVSGRSATHGTAIMLARGEFELGAEIESDTRSLWPAVDALLGRRRPRPALPARRHARRRGLGAQRAGARVRRRDARARGGRAGATRRSRARRSCSGSTRCTSPTRACSSPSSRPSTRRPRSPRCAPPARAASSAGGRDRRGEDRARRHGARGDGVRRQAGHGPARR